MLVDNPRGNTTGSYLKEITTGSTDIHVVMGLKQAYISMPAGVSPKISMQVHVDMDIYVYGHVCI